MKRCIVVLLAFLPVFLCAQIKLKNKKYPSLLWEITGNGMHKPSYLFGTMHVSSKIAFHLADSFYLGIRNADVVALETNPESWQEDMNKYDLGNLEITARFLSVPDDYFTINTLKFYKYDKKIERALYGSSSSINNLLYRSYGNESSDFEEDTYLDMYIYQCGKKWGKKVAGVEHYGESMKLMQEAYKDAARDRNKKERNFDVDDEYSSSRLQEAYRKGNLDQLDSINKLNSFSEAFDEKFLYKRNEIQALSIDSILKTKSTLFVGVGAAHLPGSRGVIEILRGMGYRLRPIMMGERDSRHKEEVERVRVPVKFNTEVADDGLFKVDVPGRFYKFGEDEAWDQRQYADMANGSYYMVTRIMTNAWMWGDHPDNVFRRVDSLLYENIPGKIVNRIPITRNGYRGLDITNKTRRGDLQRYHIYVTPFEVIMFKMSGNGEYVKNGEEAKKFFGSIQFRENTAVPEWKSFTPKHGGFRLNFPHTPYEGNDGSWIYDAVDKKTNNYFRLVRSDIHNYHFVEEDSFDLGLMDESFAASEFIEKRISRKALNYKGYPALDCKYQDKKGSIFLTRFIIQGPHYYSLVAYGKQETAQMQDYLNSFEIIPFQYGPVRERKDTALYFQVKSPVFPVQDKEKLDIPRFNFFGMEPEESSEDDALEGGVYRNTVISNDSTGEKIFVSFYRYPRYFYPRDSIAVEKNNEFPYGGDTSWIIRSSQKTVMPGKMKVWETIVSDTGSSRMLWSKRFFKDGVRYSILTQTDTITAPSTFLKTFFETYQPSDNLVGINLYERKSAIFFSDFMSSDSVAHKRAVKNIELINLDSSDFPQLVSAIRSLDFKEKRYLNTKKSLIQKLDGMKTRQAADYLRDSYYAAGDTIELQYTILETLLQQKTAYAYQLFRDIIVAEPPVIENSAILDWHYELFSRRPAVTRTGFKYDDDNFLNELADSLALTKKILPDLLPLLNLDDYKVPMMNLLAKMVVNNMAGPGDYSQYFSKFLIEAKQQIKKQAIADKKKAIDKAEEDKIDRKTVTREEMDGGNVMLELYATLLLPFWDEQPSVRQLFDQMLHLTDKEVRYNTVLLLLKNNRAYPDSMLANYAALDEYRYPLYQDLRKAKKQALFPRRYNNHLDLGKSSLIANKSLNKPDSVLFITRLPATYKGKKGYVYFYKYKQKKDDLTWRIATVGLIPENPSEFEFYKGINDEMEGYTTNNEEEADFDFTGFTETKINEEEPLTIQLQKELKKMLYIRRKSAKEFYGDRDYDRYNLLGNRFNTGN